MQNVAYCFNTNTYNGGFVYLGADPVLEWLSPLDPRARHRALSINRVAGVGDWLFLTNKFTQWSGNFERSAMPVLFCYGDPGVGKTYLRY